MSDTMKTFLFALVLSLVCSSILAAVSHFWQPRYLANKQLERKAQTLSVLGVDIGKKPTRAEINDLYEKNVIATEVKDDSGKVIMPAYLYKDQQSGELKAVAFPVEGKGLWGPIKGMVALKADLKTILGVRFIENEATDDEDNHHQK